MPIDQAHEQNNAIVKGSGGAVGLTQNSSAFKKWLLAGPEQARLIQAFEKQFLVEKEGECFHRDEGLSTQKTFKLHVLSLVEAIKDMSNPFLDQSEELLMLGSGNVMDESVVETVRKIEELGKEQFTSYYKSVLVDCSHSIHEPIKKTASHSSNAQSPNQKQNKQRLLKI